MKVREDAGDPSKKIGMPMAGDDAKAIAVATQLVREAGFEPVLIGPLEMGKYLIPGTPLGGRTYAGRNKANRREPEVSRS